jgi:hypothetical protein
MRIHTIQTNQKRTQTTVSPARTLRETIRKVNKGKVKGLYKIFAFKDALKSNQNAQDIINNQTPLRAKKPGTKTQALKVIS